MNQCEDRKVQNIPRKPKRANGRERYTALLDALGELLVEREAADISLADIAEAANVPTASIYHFFPTRLAGFVALAERYTHALARKLDAWTIPAKDVTSWEVYIDRGLQEAADYFNEHPVALKLLYDSECSAHIRRLNLSGFAHSADSFYEAINRHFYAPPRDTLIKQLDLGISIVEQVWISSFIRHGYITDEYLDEGKLAAVSYLRCYLPKKMQFRPFEERDEATRLRAEAFSANAERESVVVPMDGSEILRTTD